MGDTTGGSGPVGDDGLRGAWPFRRLDPIAAPTDLRVWVVSHTHWDREWYAPLDWFRARLVVTVDRVLELLAEDGGWRFVLDGQVSVVEDYLTDRPGRRAELVAAVESGRLAIGPWYVQPDSLLPSAESHVRNLLEGRHAARSLGPVSRVAYTPDSFGHPAWFPSLFAGFGLRAFVFWRGHGDERDHLPAVWRWESVEGSSVTAVHLEGSYLAAATLEDDVETAAARLTNVAAALSSRSPGAVLLMNGVDHSVPDGHTGAVAEAIARRTGWRVRRGTLDEAVADLPDPSITWRGPLTGGRDANLLPGVWSSRMPMKTANRSLEEALWTCEHLAAVDHLAGGCDERPVLHRIRRALLVGQAHDTLGGCSIDAVDREAMARAEAATTAAGATSRRLGARLAGAGPGQLGPWSDTFDVAVWNPLPWARRAEVAVQVNGWPAFRIQASGVQRHPAHVASMDGSGFVIDARPCRVVTTSDVDAERLTPDQRVIDLVTVVDLPPLGWARLRVERSTTPLAELDDVVDEVGVLEHPSGAWVEVAPDGTLTYGAPASGAGPGRATRRWSGLLDLVDDGDRGDAYDRDLLGDGDRVRHDVVTWQRRRSPLTGEGDLLVRRQFLVPAGLNENRDERISELVSVVADMVVSIGPTGTLEVDVRIDTTARDHCLRLRLPVGDGIVRYATQFGAQDMIPHHDAATNWVHPPPETVCHQGWLQGGGLLVSAPGLPEAAHHDGVLELTLLRSVGWMSRPDLRTRPGRASPAIPIPGAQVGSVRARLTIEADPGDDASRWRRHLDVTRRPVVSVAGDAPVVEPGRSVIDVAGGVATAIKPADDGEGVIVRVWNPSPEPASVRIMSDLVDRIVRCRLDEESVDGTVLRLIDDRVDVPLAPFEIVTLRAVSDQV